MCPFLLEAYDWYWATPVERQPTQTGLPLALCAFHSGSNLNYLIHPPFPSLLPCMIANSDDGGCGGGDDHCLLLFYFLATSKVNSAGTNL